MIELHFEKRSFSIGRGFEILYKSLPASNTYCGGVYTKTGHTIGLTLNSEGEYMPNLECYWVIIAPRDNFIYIDWKSFQLEESTDCNYDYVEIYDHLVTEETTKPLARYENRYLK